MTAANPAWFYVVVQLAGASLAAAVYLAGLVIALRRWHLGTGARLGAIGFGVLLVTLIGTQAFYQLRPLFDDSTSQEAMFLQLAIAMSLNTLLTVSGAGLVVLGLRAALQQVARLSAEPHELRESDLRSSR